MYKISSLQVLILLILLCIGVAPQATCQPSKSIKILTHTPQRFLLRDEGLSQLSYEDLAHPSHNWYVPVPPGRDMQLIGHDRVLIGTGSGYEERSIKTGKKLFELNSFEGTLSAHRLRNGNTLLTGMNWQGKKGILLVEVNSKGSIEHLINYPPEFTYLRLVRQTPTGTFLVAAEDTVFEGNAAGEVLWKVKLTGPAKPHVWQAIRFDNGQTLVSAGYAANLQIFDANGKQKDTISGPAEVHPFFFGGFQVLDNGNYVVTNWQGHGAALGDKGIQLLEYTPAGKLVWSWKQDPARYSSLQGVIVLDGLDTKFLHVENGKGMLAPVKTMR